MENRPIERYCWQMESNRPASRGLSAFEFLLGAGIVLGYNVFKVLPNEVPILVVLGLLSARLRNGGLSALGFRRPDSWSRIVWIALAAAAARIVLGEFVVDPITTQFWPPTELPSEAEEITGNLPYALLALGFVWGFAAFGEEIGYRGYLLRRAADVGGGGKGAYWAGVVLVAILFGVGHFWKGPAGMIDSGVAGLILGSAFMLSGRNLWASILAHGFIDTFGLVLVYFGLAS